MTLRKGSTLRASLLMGCALLAVPSVFIRAQSRASVPVSATKPQHNTGSDLVARDTVTYLDKSFDRRMPKKSSSKINAAKTQGPRHSKTHPHRGDIVAANTVIYLKSKPATKPAQ